jgi:N-methylhydantoinase B
VAKLVIDPITTEVVRYELVSAAEEIKRVFRRTTTIDALYELNDFGMSIYDEDVNLIADAPGIPLFAGPLDFCVRACVEHLGLENLRPGDVIVNTVPYEIGSQPIDAALIAPIFSGGELIAYAALKAHMGDLGAKDPYPTNATDVFQEGLLLPGMWLYREGRLVDEVIRLIKQHSRIPFLTATNFIAGAAALRIGCDRVERIAERYGVGGFRTAVNEILTHGERISRKALAEIPDGKWSIVDYMDNNGVDDAPVKIAVTVEKSGDDMIVDLSESAPQQGGPINSPYPGTVAALRYVVKALTAPRAPTNEGHFRPLKVIAPPGTLFHPEPPAPCFLSGWSQLRLLDLIPAALAGVLPERVIAVSGSEFCPIIMVSFDSEGRGSYMAGGADGIGLGAAFNRDGQNAIFLHAGSGMCNIPCEVREKTPVPVIIERYALRQDSGGPGKFRGGVGVVKDFYPTIPVTTISVVEKTSATTVEGVDGGRMGAMNSVVFFPGTDREATRGKYKTEMAPGEVVGLRSGGGAGWGDAFDRGPELVLEDVIDGYVSVEGAERDYGVVVVETADGYAVDAEKTAARRQTAERGAGAARSADRSTSGADN